MSGSSHIRSVLIGIKYRNCRQTLDVYLIFAIWMGQIQSTLIYIFVTHGQASLQVTSLKFSFDLICPSRIAKSK